MDGECACPRVHSDSCSAGVVMVLVTGPLLRPLLHMSAQPLCCLPVEPAAPQPQNTMRIALPMPFSHPPRPEQAPEVIEQSPDNIGFRKEGGGAPADGYDEAADIWSLGITAMEVGGCATFQCVGVVRSEAADIWSLGITVMEVGVVSVCECTVQRGLCLSAAAGMGRMSTHPQTSYPIRLFSWPTGSRRACMWPPSACSS